MKKILKTVGHLRAAAGFSLAGMAAAYRSEIAFRLEVWLGLGLGATALWLDVSAAERALLILTAFLPMVAELLNTAVEAVTDIASPDKQPLAKKAKDAGSAAVLLTVAAAAAVWLIILLPKWQWL